MSHIIGYFKDLAEYNIIRTVKNTFIGGKYTMRRTRRSSKKSNVNKWANIFVFFVVAPAVAILISLGLVKYLLLPQFMPDKEANSVIDNVSKDTDQNQDEENSGKDNEENSENSNNNNSGIATYKLDGMNLFSIQVGSFSSNDNAEKLVNQLKENNLDGYIVDQESYKVFTGTFFSKEETETYLEIVRETYNDAFIKSFDINGSTIKYNVNNKQYMDIVAIIISDLNNAFGQESSLWTDALKNGDVQAVKETMTNNNEKLSNQILGVKDKVSGGELDELINEIENKLNQRKEVVNNLETNNIQSINSSYVKFNTILFEYMKVITKQQ
ncbi:MAG: SPOR domain-containing protein [Firmicutes bacterium]|nr:SPOR domain-containing protein [Bacillota bacterium]